MGRIRLPRRPDPSRVAAARVAAARVATASALQAASEEIATVAADIPPDYASVIADINERLEALEAPPP